MRRIEGGLDSLADLEDKVAGRASQLYSSTVETASSAIKIPQLLSAKNPSNPHPALNNQDDESDFEPDATTPTVKVPFGVSRNEEEKWPENRPGVANPVIRGEICDVSKPTLDINWT